jgi:hypothetical protein
MVTVNYFYDYPARLRCFFILVYVIEYKTMPERDMSHSK